MADLVETALDDLLLRTATGDKNAFRALYDRQSPKLYGLALRLMRQPAAASDAVHDTFLDVWQHASRFDPQRGNAAAWLCTMLRNRAIDILRRHGREDTGYERPEDVDPSPDPLANLETSEAGSALRHCLDALDARQRSVIVMAFLDGQTHAELSTTLKVPLGTVKSWVRRALHALRSCLGS